MNITVTIENEKEVAAKLQRIGQSLYDFSKELRDTGKYLVDYFSTVPFATLGKVYGARWPDVSPATYREKEKHYPQNAHNILQRTGVLKNSFVFLSTKNALAIENNARSKNGFSYFLAHQLGTATIPQRLVMAFNDQNKKAVIEILQQGIQARINQIK